MTDVTLRVCSLDDEKALRGIAERDSSGVPSGTLLGAVIEGELVAAISLGSGQVIADPFRPTADAVELLRRRADQIQRTAGGRGRFLRSRRRARIGAEPRGETQ